MVAHHALVLLAVMLLLAYCHVAHGCKQGQLIAAPIAQELTMRLLSTLGLVELDLRQLSLGPLITGFIIPKWMPV